MTDQVEHDAQLIEELERRLEDRLSPRTTTAQLTHPIVAVQSAMVRRFLTTQLATVTLAYPTPGVRSVRIAVGVQQEIIQAGWGALLEGLFAAALQPLRLVKELSDYIMTRERYGSRGEPTPFRIKQEWSRLIERESPEFTSFLLAAGAGRAEEQKELSRFSHASPSLLEAVAAKDEHGHYIPSDENTDWLKQIAGMYVNQAIAGLMLTGYAVAEEAPRHSRPWTAAYLACQEGWAAWKRYGDPAGGPSVPPRPILD